MLTAALSAALACLVWPGRGGTGGNLETEGSRPGGEGVAASWLVEAVSRARWTAPSRADPGWVADFAEVVAVGLDAGLDLPAAALASARSPGVQAGAPWLVEHLRAAVDAGRGMATALDGALDPDLDLGLRGDARRDLVLLRSAWRLAEEVGATASAVTASAAASVRERRAAADRTAVVVAGPRASMLLLSALPLAGPVAAVLVGLAPSRLYDSTASRLLAVAGLLLSAAGWWWARGLLRRARRPGCTDGALT